MTVKDLRDIEDCPKTVKIQCLTEKLVPHKDDKASVTQLEGRDETSWEGRVEALQIIRLAVPVALTNLFEYLPVLFLVSAVGHLSNSREDLAATALGRNFFNACWAIAWGFTSALHTLAPQAEGAGRPDLHALHCQRAALIVSVVSVPLAVMQCFSGDILRTLGQDETVSDAAQPFAMSLIPRLYAEGYFTILQRVAQAMGFANGVAMLTSAGCLSSAGFLWLFIGVLGFGYLGAAWACVAWNAFNMTTLAVFLFFRSATSRKLFLPYKPWRQVCQPSGLWEYVSLAVPSTLQSCLEWWAIDLGVMLAAGLLPDPDLNLGANAIVASVADLIYMVWLGIQGATSIEVGKYVGAGDSRGAQRSIRMACVVGVAFASLVSSTLLFGRHYIAVALTTSAELQVKVANTLLLLSVNAFADCLNCVLGGVLRGIGRQSKGVVFQFVGFYLVGFPMGALLLTQYGHTAYGLECLWVAVGCSALTSMLCSAAYIVRADWAAILLESRLRNS
eukprot:TRINITY_DN4225_c0_g1_i1.p1 TRINITY_DN4225_c0_g1~~TRINITY_DN4225_c0_g1_i1.p1  ORF type:complete len:518 (+),score=65.18 TRINITY_DN4225_c0_g1_i1:45-1556(+)